MKVTGRQLLKYSAARAAASAVGLDLPLPAEVAAAGRTPRSGGHDVAIAGVIVAIEDGSIEQVLPRLGALSGVSVFGVKDDQIVTVVEAQTPAAVDGIVRTVAELERVVGIYPVFPGDGA